MAHSRPCLASLLAFGLSLLAASSARAAATDWIGDQHAAVRLITAADSLAGGSTIEAGLDFRFAPGWHGYWRTPGDAGLPPMIDWSGSDNLASSVLAWPAPTRLVVEGLQNGIYTGDVVLPATLGLKAPGAPARLRVSVAYAACSDICVPYQADMALDLPQGTGAASAEAPLIAAARARVPGTPEAARIRLLGTAVEQTGGARRLVVSAHSAGAPFKQPDLFIEGAGDGFPAAPEVTLSNGGLDARLAVTLPASVSPDAAVIATLVDGDRAAEFAAGPAPIPAAPSLGLWAILGTALLGGLILNLMPCVLPVLSIKLFGLTRHAGAGRRAVRLGFVATALGIVVSFVLLAGVLVALTWSGTSLGWGIQFQQPWFLAGMASITVLFAASFFGWLEIGLPSALMNFGGTRPHGAIVEAFLVGVFATLLATPCSAPFVGTAVGFALARGPVEILLVFLCLGIGMALPYAAAALFPGVVRWLPRPGPWMIRLRQVLGVLLLGTAVWLLFVLWSTAGAGIAGATALALALLLAVRGLGRGRPWTRPAAAALCLAPVMIALLPAAAPAAATDQAWQVFDADALPRLVTEGKTVLVDVTASWCLTCKINEIAALGRADVAARLAGPDTVRLRADWSRPDAAIAAYLHRFGRYGIPLDVVYGPGRPQGEALPELLTPGLVLEALDRASAKTPAIASTP